MNETPSPTGAKRCLAWMKACEEMGWPKSAMPALVDIFWKYKDRDGNLKDERPAQETAPVLDHKFIPDGMDPGICQKCSANRASHRDSSLNR